MIGPHPRVAPDLPPHVGCAWVEDPPVLCGMDAEWHLVWEASGEGALLCTLHRALVLQNWCPLLTHRHEPTCDTGRPDYHANKCVDPVADLLPYVSEAADLVLT